VICPSYPKSSARLELGRQGPDGFVTFHETPVVLAPSARTRYAQYELHVNDTGRYAGPCVSAECVNWDDGCLLGRHLASAASRPSTPCSIADRCRWFNENGAAACSTCQVVTYRLHTKEVPSE